MSDQDKAVQPSGSKTAKKTRPTAFAAQKMQEAFVANYVANGFRDGKAAAIAAGYAEKNAYVQASALLKQPKIQEMIDAYCRRQLKKTDRLAMKTLDLIEAQAESDITDVLAFNQNGIDVKDSRELPKRITRNIKGVRITKTITTRGKGEDVTTVVTLHHDITMHGVDKAKELLANITGLTRTAEPGAGPDPDANAESALDRTERLLQLTGRLKKSAKIAKKAKSE